jgi:predicted RNA binding protein YcfA (HicA-like mRNA interferase family)
MTRLPDCGVKKWFATLLTLGFSVARTRGSHIFLKHADGRATAVPVHSREVIGPGLLRSIPRDIDMTVEEFSEYL